MPKDPLRSPELYFNRELSWLEFNDRVLREGLAEDVPLLERVKFLGIVSSNLDEFFLVRVAGLMQARSAGLSRRDPSGLTPAAQLTAVSRRVHRMAEEQALGVREALRQLSEQGLTVLGPGEWTATQRQFLAVHFAKEILPVLTPLAVEELRPRPHVAGLQWHVAVVLASAQGQERIVVTPVPNPCPRWITLPAGPAGGTCLARLEDVMAAHAAAVFPGARVLATALLRVTRDAEVFVQRQEGDDMLEAVERAVLSRQRRPAVRLQVSPEADPRIARWLGEWLRLGPEETYEVDAPCGAAALAELAQWPGFEQLRNADWPPQPPRDLLAAGDLWEALSDHDVLLMHPYESFEPVVRLVEQAAADPQVLAIKQTLYRTSGDSPIVRALGQAAQNGKEVTVLVELRARFDEARNIRWARRLEDLGCHVIYGIAGYKTHAKALLVVRRESQRIQRYVHLGTGNYNDRTARLYSDLGLMTTDRDVAADVAAFFNLLTGCSESVGWLKLAVAPTGLRRRFIELIEREIQVSTPDRPGLIMAKINSLEDPAICRALYRASQGGVQVMLNVRGICVLRPGVEGVSDRIEVRSIIDRYLEHARVFYFRNGGHEEVYLSSADWMRRNLLKRLEILFPVGDAGLRRRLIDILGTFFADNVKARRLLPGGTYEPVGRDGPRVRAQMKFYKDAVAATQLAQQTALQFHPLERPKE
ncbi:MAG: polyphosphate kinase 1 [Thermoguttaceae bacterium]|jgi:polyphosphate kinase